MFILSNEDYVYQVQLLGEASFLETLDRRLSDSARARRLPYLVAPEECLRKLEKRPSAVRFEGFSKCGYRTFDQILMSAEYAFYWNAISNSILRRAVAELPVFFFHQGHLDHAVRGIRERAMAQYYKGASLPLLDPTLDLDPGLLEQLAKSQIQGFGEARESVFSQPSPDEMVERLLASGPR